MQYPKWPLEEDNALYILKVYAPGEWQDDADLLSLGRLARGFELADDEGDVFRGFDGRDDGRLGPDGGRLGPLRLGPSFASTAVAALLHWFDADDAERRRLRLPPFPAYERGVIQCAKSAAEAKAAKAAKDAERAQRRPPAPDALPEFDVHSRPAGASPADGDDGDDEGVAPRDTADAIAGAMRTALSRTRAGDGGDGADSAAALLDLFRTHAGADTTDWTSVGGPPPPPDNLAERARAAARVGPRREAEATNPLALSSGRAWRAVGKQRVVLALYIRALLDDSMLRLAVFGCGGAGKSFCIGAVTDLGRLYRGEREAVANMAQTSSAGRAIPDGGTIQSFHPECPPKFPELRRDTALATVKCSTGGLDALRTKLRVSGTRGDVTIQVRARAPAARLRAVTTMVSMR